MACCCGGPTNCELCCTHKCPSGSAFAGKPCSDIYMDFSVAATDITASGFITPSGPRPCVESGAFSYTLPWATWAGGGNQSPFQNLRASLCKLGFYVDPFIWGDRIVLLTGGKSAFTTQLQCELSFQVRNGACFAVLSLKQPYFLGVYYPDSPFSNIETGQILSLYTTRFSIEGNPPNDRTVIVERQIECITDIVGMSGSINMTSDAGTRQALAILLVNSICGSSTLGFSGGVATVTVENVSLLP
jgi:hypothetical protein